MQVSYVLDTEDVLVRHRRGLTRAKQEHMRAKRLAALAAWMQVGGTAVSMGPGPCRM